jgi:hypothetical protein
MARDVTGEARVGAGNDVLGRFRDAYGEEVGVRTRLVDGTRFAKSCLVGYVEDHDVGTEGSYIRGKTADPVTHLYVIDVVAGSQAARQ